MHWCRVAIHNYSISKRKLQYLNFAISDLNLNLKRQTSQFIKLYLEIFKGNKTENMHNKFDEMGWKWNNFLLKIVYNCEILFLTIKDNNYLLNSVEFCLILLKCLKFLLNIPPVLRNWSFLSIKYPLASFLSLTRDKSCSCLPIEWIEIGPAEDFGVVHRGDLGRRRGNDESGVHTSHRYGIALFGV